MSLMPHYNKVVRLDKERKQITVQGGLRLFDLTTFLNAQSPPLALANLPSVWEQSIAGLLATATHGTGQSLAACSGCCADPYAVVWRVCSGITEKNMASYIVAVQLVTGTGEVLTVSATENAHFLEAVRVSLGALGIVTEVLNARTLACGGAFASADRGWRCSLLL
jgi:L-gulonolactone oxidase